MRRILSALNPFGRSGCLALDLAYVAALGAFAGMCIAFAAAWKSADPATVGRGVPAEPRNLLPLEPSNPGTTEHTEMKHDILTVGFLWALAGVESGHNDAAVNRVLGVVRLESSATGTHLHSSVLPRKWDVQILETEEVRAGGVTFLAEHGTVSKAFFSATNDNASFLRRIRRKLARILSRRHGAAGN